MNTREIFGESKRKKDEKDEMKRRDKIIFNGRNKEVEYPPFAFVLICFASRYMESYGTQMHSTIQFEVIVRSQMK